MAEQFELSMVFPTAPRELYEAWLDGKTHSQFTGAEAVIDPVAGGEFTAWDGYIWGKTLEFQPYERIVQSWRTTEFPADAPDSQLEVLLQKHPGGTQLILRHSNIPDGQGQNYKQGWHDYYFTPMQEYF